MLMPASWRNGLLTVAAGACASYGASSGATLFHQPPLCSKRPLRLCGLVLFDGELAASEGSEG